MGVPFPTDHPAVAAFAVSAPGRNPTQRKPIEMEAVWRLLRMASAGSQAPHILMRLCLLLALAVVRYKHTCISRRLEFRERLVVFECSRGKRRVAGHRPPFQWAMPRLLEPGCDLAAPVLALLSEIERKLGSEITFVVPDVEGPLKTLPANPTWLPVAMPYSRWVAVLRAIAQALELPLELGAQLWATYTFRRLLPTIADVIGLHEGHRQALGEWTEQVKASGSAATAAQPLMCHTYANNKVATAGETKLMVACAIPLAMSLDPTASAIEDLRRLRVSVSALDKYSSALNLEPSDPSAARPFSWGQAPADVPSAASHVQEQLTQDTSDATLEWFAQAGAEARAHIQQSQGLDGRRIPWCRKGASFQKAASISGHGLQSLLSFSPGVCDVCLLRMPSDLAQLIQEAVAGQADDSTSCDEDSDIEETEAIRDWRAEYMGSQ